MARSAAKETTLREDMAAAMESLENPDETEVVEETHDTETAPVQEEAPQEVPVSEETGPVTAAPARSEVQQEVDRGKVGKPPVDWPIAKKDTWAKLDPDTRQYISDRERHINSTLQETVAARRVADSFLRTAEPYRALMAAEGVNDPIQAFQGLMNVTATLAMGSPQQKAERIAGLCKHYGVDIEMLDAALVGSLPQNPQQSQFEQLLDQRMAPVNQLLAQINQANQNQHNQLMPTCQPDHRPVR